MFLFGKGYFAMKKQIMIIISLFVLLSVLGGCYAMPEEPEQVLQKVELRAVKDGDTIVVKESDGNVITVRLIGIDAPESVASEEYTEKTGKENSEYGVMASEHLKELLQGSDILYLQYDKERVDKYDRTLAYVYASNDGDITGMVNGWMVKDGYATIMEIEPNTKYADRFEFYQNYAKNEGIGLWQYEEFANQ